MALANYEVTTSALSAYSSSGNNAITTLIICNKEIYNSGTPTSGLTYLYLYAVPQADVSGGAQDKHLIVNGLPIPAGETVSLDQEKMVLANGDAIFAKSDSPANLVMTVSTLPV
jgi:hypothetical protein